MFGKVLLKYDGVLHVGVNRTLCGLVLTLILSCPIFAQMQESYRQNPKQAMVASPVTRAIQWTEAEVAANRSIWVSTDGDLNAAASWSPIGVPTLDASLLFNNSSDMDLISNLSTFSEFDTELLWFQPSFDGDVGASDNPLVTKTHRFVHQGTGSVFHDTSTGHSASSYIVIDSPNQHDAYTMTGGFGAYLHCINGGVHILDTVSGLQRLMIGSKPSRLPSETKPAKPRVVIEAFASGTINDYMQTSGYVTLKQGYVNAVISGGLLVIDSTMSSGSTGTLYIAGGRVQWDGLVIPAVIYVGNGTLDMMQDTREKALNHVILLPGAKFLTHENIIVTYLTDLRGNFPIITQEP